MAPEGVAWAHSDVGKLMLALVVALLYAQADPQNLLVEGYRDGVPEAVSVCRVPGRDLDDEPMYLVPEAAHAYEDLVEAAALAGFELHANFAFRFMWQQKALYHQSHRLAAVPGHSTHQLGLSVDLSGVVVPHHGRQRTDLYRWLVANAPAYGFVRDVGYEPWHFTFRSLDERK